MERLLLPSLLLAAQDQNHSLHYSSSSDNMQKQWHLLAGLTLSIILKSSVTAYFLLETGIKGIADGTINNYLNMRILTAYCGRRGVDEFVCYYKGDVKKATCSLASTVSRVIHNSPTISEKTKRRKVRLLKEMGYHMNENAGT